MKKCCIILLIIVLNLHCYSQTPKKAETVELDGVETYYEVYGEGEPLFMLHYMTGSTTFWNEYVNEFKDKYEVYLVDIKGHGKSAPLQSDFSLQGAVDNFLALLNYLQLDKIKAIGLSYGGELLLKLCISNSHKIESMIIIGAEYNFRGEEINWKFEDLSPEDLEGYRELHIYGDEQIKALFKLLNTYEIKLTNEQISKISPSTLLIFGEKDEFFPDLSKLINLHKHLPDSHLWIVPNKGHFAFTGNNKTEFIRISKEFLRGDWQ